MHLEGWPRWGISSNKHIGRYYHCCSSNNNLPILSGEGCLPVCQQVWSKRWWVQVNTYKEQLHTVFLKRVKNKEEMQKSWWQWNNYITHSLKDNPSVASLMTYTVPFMLQPNIYPRRMVSRWWRLCWRYDCTSETGISKQKCLHCKFVTMFIISKNHYRWLHSLIYVGKTGLFLWAVTLAGILLGGALLVYNTSALASWSLSAAKPKYALNDVCI